MFTMDDTYERAQDIANAATNGAFAALDATDWCQTRAWGISAVVCFFRNTARTFDSLCSTMSFRIWDTQLKRNVLRNILDYSVILGAFTIRF